MASTSKRKLSPRKPDQPKPTLSSPDHKKPRREYGSDDNDNDTEMKPPSPQNQNDAFNNIEDSSTDSETNDAMEDQPVIEEIVNDEFADGKQDNNNDKIQVNGAESNDEINPIDSSPVAIVNDNKQHYFLKTQSQEQSAVEMVFTVFPQIKKKIWTISNG
eukprot:136048_1